MKGSGLSLYHSNVLFHRWSKTFQAPISALTRVTHHCPHWHPLKETSSSRQALLEEKYAGKDFITRTTVCSILHESTRQVQYVLLVRGDARVDTHCYGLEYTLNKECN